MQVLIEKFERMIHAQVMENGSVILARFSYTYKCTKTESYLPVNCVKFLLNPLSATRSKAAK